jgi:hypothetical protein
VPRNPDYQNKAPKGTEEDALAFAPIEQSIYAAISARIPRYCFAEDKYWFVVEVDLEDGRHWELSRYYQDFYDFQMQLIKEFPVEAGNTKAQKRTLLLMLGPVSNVTDAISEARQHNLDAYVKNLLIQPPHISRCTLVKLFFAPREGDCEIDLPDPLPPATPRSPEPPRWKFVQEVEPYYGNLIVDLPQSESILSKVLLSAPPERDELTHIRYTALVVRITLPMRDFNYVVNCLRDLARQRFS